MDRHVVHTGHHRQFTRRGVAATLAMLFMLVPLGVPAVSVAQGTPSLEIVSPSPGETITANEVEITVAVENFTIDCAQTGRPDEQNVGHIHAMVDGMTMATLGNFYCDTTFSVSLAGLEPGTHTLIVDLSSNTHMDMMETAQEVDIDYQPTHPVSLPEGELTGTPGITLVSPADGATVPPVFTVQVEPVNFMPSGEIEGRGNVPGYGHYHVFVDTPMGEMSMMAGSSMEATPEQGMGEMEMMSMAGMVLMPGTNTFELDLSAWGPGEHTIWIEPVQNDHTMFEEFGHVEFTVVVDENATPAP